MAGCLYRSNSPYLKEKSLSHFTLYTIIINLHAEASPLNERWSDVPSKPQL